MQLSADTEEVLKFLDYTSGGNLRKRNDIGVILEIGATFSQAELVNRLIFDGSSLWNFSELIRKEAPDSENIAHLYNEQGKVINLLRDDFIEISKLSDNHEIQTRFLDVYLSATQGAYRNLIDIAHDLYELKNVQNKLKRND